MRVSTDGDSVTLETESEDKELASAAADVVGGTVRLIDSLGLRECERCGDRGRLRGYDIIIDGEFQVMDICPECQQDWVDEAAAQAEGDGDRLNDPSDLEPTADTDPVDDLDPLDQTDA